MSKFHTPKPLLNKEEKEQKIKEYVDKLIPYFHEYDKFDFNKVIIEFKKKNELEDSEKSKINEISDDIRERFKKLEIIIKNDYADDYFELTNFGRTVQSFGSYSKYMECNNELTKKSEEINTLQHEKLNEEIKKLKHDNTVGQKQVKNSILRSNIALLASIIIPFLVIFINYKTKSEHSKEDQNSLYEKNDSLEIKINQIEKAIEFINKKNNLVDTLNTD